MTIAAPAAEEAAAPSFTDLYRATAADVFAYVATLLGDRAAAEDVTAQAFERAYRKRRSYDARRGSERAWLFGIARNAALDELRRRRRTLALVDEPAEVEAVESAADVAVRRATVRAARERLEPRDRELIALTFRADLTNAERAELLGTSESNGGTRLQRAVAMLQEACS